MLSEGERRKERGTRRRKEVGIVQQSLRPLLLHLCALLKVLEIIAGLLEMVEQRVRVKLIRRGELQAERLERLEQRRQ